MLRALLLVVMTAIVGCGPRIRYEDALQRYNSEAETLEQLESRKRAFIAENETNIGLIESPGLAQELRDDVATALEPLETDIAKQRQQVLRAQELMESAR